MHTLIPNPNPNLRVLLHRVGDEVYLTVEKSETDAIGTPQWRIEDDGRCENVQAAAILAAIEYRHPQALTNAPTALGTTVNNGCTYRCSVNRDLDNRLVLVTEVQDTDQAGAPRWQYHDNAVLTDAPTNNPKLARYSPDFVVGCLFGK